MGTGERGEKGAGDAAGSGQQAAGRTTPRPRGVRPVVAVDPILEAALGPLVRDFGRDAVLAAAQAVGRRHTVDATRAEKERLAVLIDQLARVWGKGQVFGFLTKQKAVGIPVAISLEILERIVAMRPANPWALVQHIMASDYPHYRWGRG